ncbi:response regulator [Croceibacterium sp. LX-88]|uniref:Response regulator n=1 Tax=Croceibacterium selenioxidans TaxID=2838833 RepID=A0ABS5W363_9SPHN|nr:response regulator [Croceibacterium selenioxidans]MBT2134192.1 response regulator [Croceibacterium selenioxidans]
MGNERIIAVIDDDEGMRVSLDGLLRSLGYRTALFASAEAFLGDGAGRLADCVISDVAIPGGMSGLELARRLATDRPEVPLILMSGCADKSCRQEAAALGVDALLAKPFGDEMLIRFLDRALAEASPWREGGSGRSLP